MKTLTGRMTALLALLAIAGCASEKQDPSSTAATTTCTGTSCTTILNGTNGTGNGTDPATTGYAYGSTSSLVLNSSALQRMFYNSQPQNPTNPRININLNDATESVTVSYVENGVLHEAVFGTQRTTQAGGTISSTIYNGWTVQNGQNVWKGFFQDDFGAIVIVIDKSLTQGDGTASTILGGSIYFQNFQQSAYQNPLQGDLKMCWEITRGPYDCRTFLVNNAVSMTSSQYPNNRGPDKITNYEKLADFAGVSRSAAGF